MLLRAGGELVQDFQNVSASIVGPFTPAHWEPAEINYIIRRVLAEYSISYAIVNSIECRMFIAPLANAFVPVVSLIHEFASYTRPKGAMAQGLDWSTQMVFSTDLTKDSAVNEHPHLSNRQMHILPQGRCDIPHGATKAQGPSAEELRKILRPKGYEDAMVVLGAGFVHIRKGVDLFLSSAAAVMALRRGIAARGPRSCRDRLPACACVRHQQTSTNS